MTGVRRSATTLLVGVGVSVGVLAGAGPALAAERVVEIRREGVSPQELRVEPGDTVRFVNEDPTFAYRAQSTAGPWRFDSGPTLLLEDDFVVPTALTAPGTYAYRVAQDAPFTGTVVVVGTAPTAATTTAPTTAPPTAVPVPVPPTSAPPSTTTPAPVAAPAVPGPLTGPPSGRALGLAVAVAAVLLLGVTSLLLRLLLCLPVLSDRPARL